MAWENRHGRLFYYRKVREGKRVRSIYLGRCEEAYLCSELVEETNHSQRMERNLLKPDNEIESQLSALDAEIAAITKATLITAGFHQHKGTWRKKRN